MFSVAYGFLYADRVNVTRRLDALPEQYWADGLARNNAVASNLNANVPNPFHIARYDALRTSNALVYQAMSSIPFFTSPTIRKEQLLRPFPHMNGLSQIRTPDGEAKARETGADGIMIGRGMFGNPWVFAGRKPEDTPLQEKLAALVELAHAFEKLRPAKSFHILKKHVKAFVIGFDGAAELRAKLMATESAAELEAVIAASGLA